MWDNGFIEIPSWYFFGIRCNFQIDQWSIQCVEWPEGEKVGSFIWSQTFSLYDISIGNYESTSENIYKNLGQKDFKYKKEVDLTEEEQRTRDEEHARVLQRKHQREKEKMGQVINTYSRRVLLHYPIYSLTYIESRWAIAYWVLETRVQNPSSWIQNWPNFGGVYTFEGEGVRGRRIRYHQQEEKVIILTYYGDNWVFRQYRKA